MKVCHFKHLSRLFSLSLPQLYSHTQYIQCVPMKQCSTGSFFSRRSVDLFLHPPPTLQAPHPTSTHPTSAHPTSAFCQFLLSLLVNSYYHSLQIFHQSFFSFTLLVFFLQQFLRQYSFARFYTSWRTQRYEASR